MTKYEKKNLINKKIKMVNFVIEAKKIRDYTNILRVCLELRLKNKVFKSKNAFGQKLHF